MPITCQKCEEQVPSLVCFEFKFLDKNGEPTGDIHYGEFCDGCLEEGFESKTIGIICDQCGSFLTDPATYPVCGEV